MVEEMRKTMKDERKKWEQEMGEMQKAVKTMKDERKKSEQEMEEMRKAMKDERKESEQMRETREMMNAENSKLAAESRRLESELDVVKEMADDTTEWIAAGVCLARSSCLLFLLTIFSVS